MSKFVKTIILSLFVIACQAQSVTSLKNFITTYKALLSFKYRVATFTVVNDSTIECNYKGNLARISTDNAYREYRAEPDSIQSILSHYANVTGELFNGEAKVNIDNIVPVIKPVEYLNDLKSGAHELHSPGSFDIVYEKYNDQLIVAYAEDTKTHVRLLTHSDLKTLSMDSSALRTLAIKNLDKILPPIKKDGGAGLFMLSAGGTYESSLLLLSRLFTKDYLPVTGDFVIAIPNRDLLLITGSNDSRGLAKVKQMAAEFYTTGDHPISSSLYKWNGKVFERME